MGGGSGRGGASRDVAWRAYSLTLAGSLPGLRRALAKALRDDALSPGLRESLAATAREVARGGYLLTGDESRALRAAAERVNAKFSEVVARDGKYVERFKPLLAPAVHHGNPLKPLMPDRVGTWIERVERYVYVTYWLRFPYDILPNDGPEYEPFTEVIDRYSGRVVEYQFRSHWKVIRVNPEYVIHAGSRPVIAVTDFGHTPVPMLTGKGILEMLARYPGLRSIWAFMAQPLRLRGTKDPSVDVHVGPGRKEVARWRRNPLSTPWYEKI